jgi:WD40 repeat protein
MEWYIEGKGRMPWNRWTFSTDGPLSSFTLSRETGHFFVSDKIGSIYRLDATGRTLTLNRVALPIRKVAWSDNGKVGFCLIGKNILIRMDHKLKTLWEIEVSTEIIDIAIESHGHFLAISLADSTISIVDNDRNRVADFETVRPMNWLQFKMESPSLVCSASNGLICSYSLYGNKEWDENLWSALGGFDIAHGKRSLFVAGFNLGIMQINLQNGDGKGALVVEGTVTNVAASFDGQTVLGCTIEKHIFLLDTAGEVIWSCELPDSVSDIMLHPLGRTALIGLPTGQLYCLDWGNELRYSKALKLSKKKKE